jgi:hypothetical protein
MPAPRISSAPMTAAERQARHRAKLRQHSQTTPPAAAAHPATAKTVGDGGSRAHRSAGRIPRLARHSPGQS